MGGELQKKTQETHTDFGKHTFCTHRKPVGTKSETITYKQKICGEEKSLKKRGETRNSRETPWSPLCWSPTAGHGTCPYVCPVRLLWRKQIFSF